ncbi:MAG: methionine adenosyltransferase [Aigarchaeota archaeon]|nr:methionine adenosyltransferase [Candidatus Pelearchaeum maunauluense]
MSNRNIRVKVETLSTKPVEEQETEFVERKGLGHPDYMIDSACEAASVALSKYYLEKFGYIMHHNVDKGLLVGGRAVNWFGGGRIEEPIYILIAGRATTVVKTPTGDVKIPYGDIIVNAVKEFIRSKFRFLNPDEHLVIDYKVRQSSPDLKAVVEANKSMPLANDTSFGVGFYPLTKLEQLVLETEQYINSPTFKKKIPESGEDCKVMGLRLGDEIHLTIADGIISSLTPDRDHYISVKEHIREEVAELASKIFPDRDVGIYVNTADRIGGDPKEDVVYLTYTGSSAEHGDDGNTGRGNRANGLITPNRQMSLEATAGKNPVSHVGKIYNVLARIMAEKIYNQTNQELKEVYVRILSQIGKPINEPLSVSVQVIPQGASISSNVLNEINGVVYEEFGKITRITEMVLRGEAQLF